LIPVAFVGIDLLEKLPFPALLRRGTIEAMVMELVVVVVMGALGLTKSQHGGAVSLGRFS
jgi:hypothetical protein